MSDENKEPRENVLAGALRRAGILGANRSLDLQAGAPKGLDEGTMQRLRASYKPPTEQQIGQIDRGEAWWRDFAWEEYATKELPGLGMGFTVYPYVAVWEKIWGAVPTEDYQKYKQYYTQEPFIRATIDLHTQMTISQGFELDYPLETVVKDVREFLDRHDFTNLLKILVKDMFVFGNAYCEVVRTWYCLDPGEHDLEALRISYKTTTKDGKRYWWTDRMEVADRHNKMYPDHKLVNKYGEITRFKPLDPMYMRVRRDAYGTILGYVQYYVFPLVTFLADEMIHIRYMPTSWTYESIYGVSMLRPILFHQELIKNYEQTMGAIMNVFLKPMFLVRVGGANTAGLPAPEVSAQQYNTVKRFFQQAQPGQSLVIRATTPVQVDPIDPPIDRMQSTAFWLQWLHNMRTYALTVPKFFTDPAGLSRATAQTVEKAYFTFTNSNRQSLNAQLERSVMTMVMQSLYGELADEIIKEFGVPKFIWKPQKEDTLEDKAKTYLPLYASRILTKNEVRKALGFEPLDEEELQKQLGPQEPPLGQTGQGGGMPGQGAPGMTKEGTPTFGSPDEKMAPSYGRPSDKEVGGQFAPEESVPSEMGAEKTEDWRAAAVNGLYDTTEAKSMLEELEEEVETLKKEVAASKEQVEAEALGEPRKPVLGRQQQPQNGTQPIENQS